MAEHNLGAAVVTGAASGIGKATALRLARDGRAIAAWDIDPAGAHRCAAEIIETGGAAVAIGVDVSDPDDVARATDATVAAVGAPGVLVTSAGTRVATSILDVDPQSWRRLMAVNLDGVFFCVASIGRVMAAAGRGSIVTIASTAALNGFPQRAAYCASKAGVVGLTRAAALELAPFGIRVNSVAPGSTLTALTKPYEHDPIIREIVDTAPLQRWGQPEEIADAIAFLAGDGAAFITGVVLPVDGGWTAARVPLRQAAAN